jgi:RNA recognition motif-containing protein
MSTKLFVGNLPYSCDDQSLHEVFSQFGEVSFARVITDHATGRSKGFGFVEMTDPNSASKAIEELNGRDFMGRNINVSEARSQKDRPRNGGGGRRFQGGSRSGSGGNRHSGPRGGSRL